MNSQRAELIEEIARLAGLAGAAIEQVRRTGFSVESKDDHSPLTDADTAAQAILGPGLALAAPEYVVLSEEALPNEFHSAADAPAYFVVDPLDGTKDFIAGTGEYSVNIALIEAGRATLGVMCRPSTGQIWIGVPGEGCERRDIDGRRTLLRVPPAGKPLKVALSRFHPSAELNAALLTLGGYTAVTLGAALKFVGLAEGLLDFYPRLKSGMSQWDICAGHAIVEAAGGAMTRIDGQPMAYSPHALTSPGFIAYGDHTIDWVGLLR
jgi:3'(2'), 5'-bisphosphate nucleotidase